MRRPSATSEGSIVTFLFAILALNPPVLTIFSVEVFLFGIPLLYLYLFAVWLVIVVLVAWIAGAGGSRTGGERNRGRRGSDHAR
ncbi:MAG: hypothetical protein ACTSW2_03000 [Alphaproteobacteria bacterium]